MKGQGDAEALTYQQRQGGLLFMQGRKQRTSLAEATEQHSHIVRSLLISLKVKRKAEDHWAGKAYPLSYWLQSHKKPHQLKNCAYIHRGETPFKACSIPWSSMKRFPAEDTVFPSFFPSSRIQVRVSLTEWPVRSNLSATPLKAGSSDYARPLCPKNEREAQDISLARSTKKPPSSRAPVGLTLSISTAGDFPQQILHRKLWTTQLR